MATYKVPQNVEAEDKILGPFTFKQFIYLIVASIGLLVAWLLFKIEPLMGLVPLPIILVFAFLGLYHREDQPVETYILAAINFFMKPRRRLWGPEGLVENVKITAPKKPPQPKARKLSEERGQLERLAHILDTRGWYTKQPELTEPLSETITGEDRLLAPTAPTDSQEPLDVHVFEDVLDPYNYRDAEKYWQLAEGSSQQARQQAISKMQQAAQQAGGSKQHVASNTSKGQEQAAVAIKYDPYGEMAQPLVEPSSGRFMSRQAAKVQKQAVSSKNHGQAGAARADVILRTMHPAAPISELAKKASRETGKASGQELAAGKPFDLAQGEEVDLPN